MSGLALRSAGSSSAGQAEIDILIKELGDIEEMIGEASKTKISLEAKLAQAEANIRHLCN